MVVMVLSVLWSTLSSFWGREHDGGDGPVCAMVSPVTFLRQGTWWWWWSCLCYGLPCHHFEAGNMMVVMVLSVLWSPLSPLWGREHDGGDGPVHAMVSPVTTLRQGTWWWWWSCLCYGLPCHHFEAGNMMVVMVLSVLWSPLSPLWGREHDGGDGPVCAMVSPVTTLRQGTWWWWWSCLCYGLPCHHFEAGNMMAVMVLSVLWSPLSPLWGREHDGGDGPVCAMVSPVTTLRQGTWWRWWSCLCYGLPCHHFEAGNMMAVMVLCMLWSPLSLLWVWGREYDDSDSSSCAAISPLSALRQGIWWQWWSCQCYDGTCHYFEIGDMIVVWSCSQTIGARVCRVTKQ